MKLLAAFWRTLRGFVLIVAALVLFVEEWGWKPLTAFAAKLARWPPLARLETHIVRARPRVALLLFLVPAALLLPVKIAALWLIELGRVAWGIALIVAAKVLGTALVGRLFILLQPQLLTFPRFCRALRWWRHTKARMHAAARRSSLWRQARTARRAWRLWLQRLTP